MNATPTPFRVRRATLEDLPQLSELWQTMHLDTDELGRRITEFQVAEAAQGKLVGAVGLEMTERQGRIHSEAFVDFAFADQVRPLFWQRLQALATNHGLLRFWTKEQAPFWKQCGLAPGHAELMGGLPSGWGDRSAKWLTLKLRDDVDTLLSADKQFELFMASERERTRKTLQHARILKLVATLIAVAIFGLALIAAFFVIRNNSRLRR